MAISAVAVDRALAAARRGDERAFAELIERYDEGLRALAYRLLGDRDRMDDVLQEAYVRAYRGLGRFRGESTVATWLYRIVYNACVDELGRSHEAVPAPIAEVDAWVDPAPEVGEAVARRQGLATALAALPPDDRAAVLLVDARGFSYDDAADVLGVPSGTVASRLNRARAALRRVLEQEGAWDE
jgi:RNA polymerase sigma-70 factor, ECF subfamily